MRNVSARPSLHRPWNGGNAFVALRERKGRHPVGQGDMKVAFVAHRNLSAPGNGGMWFWGSLRSRRTEMAL